MSQQNHAPYSHSLNENRWHSGRCKVDDSAPHPMICGKGFSQCLRVCNTPSSMVFAILWSSAGPGWGALLPLWACGLENITDNRFSEGVCRTLCDLGIEVGGAWVVFWLRDVWGACVTLTGAWLSFSFVDGGLRGAAKSSKPTYISFEALGGAAPLHAPSRRLCKISVSSHSIRSTSEITP